MDSRRIQLVGNRSYALSLPKEWVINNKLKNKDPLFIEQTGNNELIIRKSGFESSEKREIIINLEDIKNINEFIVFCYVRNVDKIRILTKKSDYEKIVLIRKILNYLEGYDITHEDEKAIEISFLFNDINVNLNNIMRRMIYLLKFMTTSLINKDSKNIEETEKSIDKLYHLSKRILFACITSQKLRADNKIRSTEELFFLKEIVRKIERIGDVIYSMQNLKITYKDSNTINEIILILEYMLDKNKIDDAKTNLNSIKILVKDKAINQKIHKIQELCKDATENFMSIQFNNKYFS
jgi:phosphate uptake regulator